MFDILNKNESGCIIFISAEEKSIDTLKRLKILKTQQLKDKSVKSPVIEMDEKDFGIGAQILHDLNITNLHLITNTQKTKRVGMIGYGLTISKYISF